MNSSQQKLVWQRISSAREDLEDRVEEQAARIAALEAGLKEAKGLIELWHNWNPVGILTIKEQEIAWILYQKSPEIKRINALLKAAK